MKRDDIKEDILKFVQTLETAYAEKILKLKKSLEKAQKQIIQERTKNVGRNMERSECE